MAQRGRPRKIKEKPTVSDAQVELTMLKITRQEEIRQLYKDLAKIRRYVDAALYQIGTVDGCENLAEAAFKAGRVYSSLDNANDRLQDMLENLHDTYDFEHYDDIYDEN